MSINCILFSVKLKNNLYRNINKQNIKTHKNIKKKEKENVIDNWFKNYIYFDILII